MKRLPIIALTLCLTALVAWGCSSGHSGPIVAPTDNIDNRDGFPTAPSDGTDTPNPGDDSTVPNPDDPSAIVQVGGGTPPVPNGGALSGGAPGGTTDSRGKLALRKDCDGNVISVPVNQTRALFNFGRPDSVALNTNRVINIKDQESGAEAAVTLTNAEWKATNPTKVVPGTFSLITGGTYPGELGDMDYGSSFTIHWDFSSTTCLKLTEWTFSHSGPFGGAGSNIQFLDGLRLTNNRYQPVLGERYATLGIDRVGVQTSNWMSEVVEIDEAFGQTYITFEIHQVGQTDVVRFIWNDTNGIVAFDELYLPTENGDNRITFPGYPSR